MGTENARTMEGESDAVESLGFRGLASGKGLGSDGVAKDV